MTTLDLDSAATIDYCLEIFPWFHHLADSYFVVPKIIPRVAVGGGENRKGA